MIDDAVSQRVEKYWATKLGIDTNRLSGRGATVVARSESNSAFLFNHRDCFIWHVPEPLVRRIECIIRANPDVVSLFQEASIAQIFGSAARRILGPCPIAYCDWHSLHSGHGMPANRLLTESDRAAVESLALACGEEAWEHGGVEFGVHKAIFGSFVNGELVSTASYEGPVQQFAETVLQSGYRSTPPHG